MGDGHREAERPLAITVAIPVRNAASTIEAQLAALAAQDFAGGWEVVVADNGSTDASVERASAFAHQLPSLRVVDASGRRGVSHARNVALRSAHGEVLAMCDADDLVDPGWLTAMAEATRQSDVVGGSLDEDRLNDPTVRAWRGRAGRTTALPVAAGFLPYAVGSNFAVRTNVARALGGWDEDFVGGMDDVEFSWRAQLSGYRLGYAHTAVVYRRQRTSLSALVRQFYGYGRSTPQLQRAFREFGVQRRPWKMSARRVVWLLSKVGHLTSVEGRGEWLRLAAKDVGELVGSVRYRISRRSAW